MLSVRLPADVEDRLDRLVKATGRSKAFYARHSIVEHLEPVRFGLNRQRGRGAPFDTALTRLLRVRMFSRLATIKPSSRVGASALYRGTARECASK